MTSQVWAALLTAVASLLVALVTALFARAGQQRASEMAERQHKLQRELATLTAEFERAMQREARMASAREKLDRHREQLIAAALDLAHRIHNIRKDWFLDTYLEGEERRQRIARTSTLYRFARYWAVVETLYDDVAMQSFEVEEQTRQVASTLRDVGRAFANDRTDGGRFMVWREEQRAIAELMRPDGSASHIGFASFVERYDNTFHPWFATFDCALSSPSLARESERFLKVQNLLADLVQQLDLSGTYRSQWAALKASALGDAGTSSDVGRPWGSA